MNLPVRESFPPKWSDPFEVPAVLTPVGISFQWCAKRADSTGDRGADYERMLDAGWVAVPPQWLPGRPTMIAGNDLMCRPKWMTERAQLDNERKAHKQVEDWAQRVGATGFSGGVRVWTGDAQKPPPEFKMIGEPAMAKLVVEASPVIPQIAAAPSPPIKSRRPRHPWLAWIFNLISVES